MEFNWLDGFVEAEYYAAGVRLRVGERPPAQVRALAPAGGLVTAWNPWGERCDEAANRQADARLQARLRALALPHWPGRCRSPDGRWDEPGWLLGIADTAALDALADAFGQRGVLAWAVGREARLRLYPRLDETAPQSTRLTRVMDTPFCDWVACPRP